MKGKNVERQKIPSECELKLQKSTKSFKTTRKKEPFGDHDSDPCFHPFPHNLLTENQVPSNGNHHHFLRKNDNKTEIISVQETASVKETKTSKLRSINRLLLPNSSSLLSKLPRSPKESLEKHSSSKQFNQIILDHKAIDKSISRKSYLNRSHTCEIVHDNTSFFRESNVKRQHLKNSYVKSIKKDDEKHESNLSSSSFEGNNTGNRKDLNCTSRFSKSKFDSPKGFVDSAGKHCLRPSAEEIIKFKLLDNNQPLQNSRKVKSGSSSPKLRTEYFQRKICNKSNSKEEIREKSKDVDVVASAENLTVSTLRIITRLDEINSKSNRRKNIFSNTNDNKVSKNIVRLNSIINANSIKNDNCARGRNNIPSKNSTLSKSINILRIKPSHNLQKDLNTSQRTENQRRLQNDKSKPSILKYKYDCQNSETSNRKIFKPISILKKKSFTQDEIRSSSLPVTFTLPVLKEEMNPKIHGILKKRLSLDENEVLRRLSYSPEINISDFKSILKNQRRSSMVELSRRSQSPDFTLQGILKQKLDKYGTSEDLVETQGILKKNFIPSLNSSPSIHLPPNNLKVFKNVVPDSSIKISENQSAEIVRPILKKKPFFDDHNSSESNLINLETPKSILKKKLNAEPDQIEEIPKKPILKSFRVSSMEELNYSSGGDSESVKPILKKENSRYNSDEENRGSVVHRRRKQRSQERPFSSTYIEEKLSTFLLKRHSLQFQLSPGNLDFETNEILSSSSFSSKGKFEKNKSFSAPNKLDNSENLNNKNENFFSSPSKVNITNIRQLESPTEIPHSESVEFSTPKLTENLIQESSSIFHKQSVSGQLSAEEENNFNKNNSSISTSSNFLTNGRIDKKMDSTCFPNEKFEENTKSESAKVNVTSLFESEDNFEAYVPSSGAPKSVEKNVPNSKNSSLDSRATLMDADLLMGESFGPSIRLKKQKDEENLKVSNSFRVTLGETVKNEAAVVGENDSTSNSEEVVNKNEERRKMKFQRFLTQPVSTQELQLAIDKNKPRAESDGEEESYEDELSKMSYSDRLKMFESKFLLHDSASLPKKRGTRFKTQPVTATEVECAKNKKVSAASKLFNRNREENIGNKEEEPNNSNSERKSPRGIFSNNANEDVSNKKISNLFLSKDQSSTKRDDLSGAKRELISELKNMLCQSSREVFDNSPKSYRSFCSRSSEKMLGTNSSDQSLGEAACVLNLPGNHKKAKEKKENFYGDTTLKKKEGCEHLRNNGKLRLISKSRSNSSMVKSQSHFSVPDVFRTALKIKSDSSLEENDKMSKGLQKSATQDLSVSEENYIEEGDISGGTIRERLERLKKSGEMDWQKRKSHIVGIEKEISILGTGNRLLEGNFICSKERVCSPNTNNYLQNEDEKSKFSSILADRLDKLDAAKEGWKKRIKPPDAINFTVEGKMMEQSECTSAISLPRSPSKTPLFERKKRCPKAIKFKSKRFPLLLNSVPTSPLENADNPIVRSLSAPGSGQRGLNKLSKTDDFKKVSVRVPKIDDESFTSFFKDSSSVAQERLEINDEDLDVITEMKSSQLLIHKRDIKTQKRRVTKKNPLKALAARLPSQEYVEIQTSKDIKKVKTEKVSGLKISNLAIETLAGLASQEDFTSVNLKKASEGSFNLQDPPYKNLMLLHVKGRRHVQTRLIEPVASNINAGDCFILVTPKNVYHYIGAFANVIEMSRSAEISLYIQQKGDLGCSTDSVITIGKNGKATADQVQKFWELLNGNPDCEKDAGNPDEDEVFESSLNDTNKVYEVVGDELIPNELFWGCSPKIEILDPNKVLIFDFGSELYVWTGKNVNLEKRKYAVKLGKEYWEEGFDYRDCDICPPVAASYIGNENSFQIPESVKFSLVRPSWSLFAKITQNMETVLFKEKFQDWPDYSRITYKSKNYGENNSKGENGANEPKSFDAKMMIENELPEQDLVLEGSHLGRGLGYFDEDTRRCSKITTHNVKVWHISDYEHAEVPSKSVGQFYMEDSFIVRWHYVITFTGRELNGQPSKYLTTGRDRYAYFFWQGCDSHINDKGTAACLTVELDKENGPQIRVDQGLEPPAFLNLFQGRMIIHEGKYMSKVCKKWRLFICRGETVTECVLTEVPCSMRHLRSGASFLLINRESSLIIVWHGWKTLEHTKKVAICAAEFIQADKPKDFRFISNNITIREESEGCESEDFLQAVGGNNRQLYFSVHADKDHVLQTPRLFHFTSLYGNFISTEIASPYLNKTVTTPYPFLQNDLYSASQPALFLMDTSIGLWLWQGWWTADSKNDGSIRFQAERRAALTTAMSYWKLKYGTQPTKIYLIWAGLEPLAFTNQFPFWTDRDDIADINLNEGKKFGEMISVEDELASLTQSTYSLSQLQNRPLPDGVNPTSLEDYLQPQYFQELFGLEKEEFFKMPSWKKKKFKQEAGLF